MTSCRSSVIAPQNRCRRYSLLTQPLVASESLHAVCVNALEHVGDGEAQQRPHDGNHTREQTLHDEIVCRLLAGRRAALWYLT
jgi:hypothetical protein